MYLPRDWAARLAMAPSPERIAKWERTWKAHHGRLLDLRYQLVLGDLTLEERHLVRAALSATRKILQGMEPPMMHRRQAHVMIRHRQGRGEWHPVI